jgi:aromatic-amino-acid transaminase
MMCVTTSLFGTLAPYAGDPILSLNEAFGQDPRTNKVNLSIGVYTDETGRLPVLESVKQSAGRLGFSARPYLPMEGHAGYRKEVQDLIFGADHNAVTAKRITTVQTIGGTGAVGLAADFLATHTPGRAVLVSDPTWENHHGLFQRAGFTTQTYPWWDSINRVASPEKTLETLTNAPKGSIIVMQPVCHNPTGIDLTVEQQNTITKLCIDNGHILLFDMAYQGFGDGLNEDASWVRRCADAGLTFMVANSFSKNFSLYGERCGGLSVVTTSAEEADLVLGQLKLAIRRSYSNGPTTGPQIIADVLSSPDLRTQWETEVGTMRDRMATMRRLLQDAITHIDSSLNVSFLTTQRGMFSYTGLTNDAVTRMRDRDAVYLVGSGRVCVAGLNHNVIEQVAQSMATELRELQK